MRLPIIKSKNIYMRETVAFGGLNLMQTFTEGELRDCSGVSHSLFPALTQRKFGKTVFKCDLPTAVIISEKECIATENALYYDRKKVGTLTPGKKSMAQIGSKIVVFPDKVYYDIKTEKFGSIEGKCNLINIAVTFTENSITVPVDKYVKDSVTQMITLKKDSKVFKYTSAEIVAGKILLSGLSITDAGNLSAGDIFSEISGNELYREVKEVTDKDLSVSVLNNCVRVKNVTKDIFVEFREGDLITVKGIGSPNDGKEARITQISGNTLLFEDGTFVSHKATTEIEIMRKIPDFSFVCAYQNRIWGSCGNTIYASKLGDPFNYYIYDNVATDSYAVESNSPGEFTAAAVVGNSCLFFKQDRCYKLFGNRPANFQLSENFCGGIQKEDRDSIVNLDGRIIYKGNGGIYSYYGGVPDCISYKVGNITMKNCVAGGNSHCYYISADTEKGREEFVYDLINGLWSKSGNKDVCGYFTNGENVYRLRKDRIEIISEKADKDAYWYAEFCPFDEKTFKGKDYVKLHIKAELFENAWIKAEIKSSDGPWKTVMTKYGNRKEYITIPCVLKNCREVKLRLSGKGRSTIENIIREFSVNRR